MMGGAGVTTEEDGGEGEYQVMTGGGENSLGGVISPVGEATQNSQ